MTELVVRRLLVDLETPFPARWNGGDAFRSAFFNALSMTFPVGEQFFIDSVRQGAKQLPPEEQARMASEVKGFIGQEATHRRIHALFNQHLTDQGLTNAFEARATRRIQSQAHLNVRMHLAATAATEHFTAIFADWMLRHPEALEGAEPRLKTLWLWHSAEESEHRNTAFDLYQSLGGDHARRLKVFRYVTVIFLTDVLRQTVRNLWHDGSLFQWRTWKSAAQLLLSKDGLFRGNVGLWKDYLRKDFHPSQHDAIASEQWLRDNIAQFSIVGQAA
jgi:predicted metal-dependent hydrolase